MQLLEVLTKGALHFFQLGRIALVPSDNEVLSVFLDLIQVTQKVDVSQGGAKVNFGKVSLYGFHAVGQGNMVDQQSNDEGDENAVAKGDLGCKFHGSSNTTAKQCFNSICKT